MTELQRSSRSQHLHVDPMHTGYRDCCHNLYSSKSCWDKNRAIESLTINCRKAGTTSITTNRDISQPSAKWGVHSILQIVFWWFSDFVYFAYYIAYFAYYQNNTHWQSAENPHISHIIMILLQFSAYCEYYVTYYFTYSAYANRPRILVGQPCFLWQHVTVAVELELVVWTPPWPASSVSPLSRGSLFKMPKLSWSSRVGDHQGRPGNKKGTQVCCWAECYMIGIYWAYYTRLIS